MKKMWLNLQKNSGQNDVGQSKNVRGDTLQGGDTRVKSNDSDEQKRSVFFRKKIGATPSVAAPGDTKLTTLMTPLHI